MIKFGNHCSTSVDNKWLPQRVNLEEVQNTLFVDKKVWPCKKFDVQVTVHHNKFL